MTIDRGDPCRQSKSPSSRPADSPDSINKPLPRKFCLAEQSDRLAKSAGRKVKLPRFVDVELKRQRDANLRRAAKQLREKNQRGW